MKSKRMREGTTYMYSVFFTDDGSTTGNMGFSIAVQIKMPNPNWYPREWQPILNCIATWYIPHIIRSLHSYDIHESADYNWVW